VNLSILAIVDLDELAEAARVVIVRRLGVAKSLKTGADRADGRRENNTQKK
jgi:hypothetical protein